MKVYRVASLIKAGVFAVGALTVMSPISALSQSGFNQEPYISIFEHCDYRGERRDIAVGDFRRMGELDFGNDSVSSIQVPRELNAVIFEHDDFKGDYARVDRDVRCFDRTWNDQVSSLKVEYRKGVQRNESRDKPTVYGGQTNERDRYQNRDNRPRDNRARAQDQQIHFSDSVNSKNLAQVVFNNRVLQQVGDRVWQVQDRRNGVSQYNEVNRDDSSVYLKNQTTGERIRIDLFVNDVTITGQNRQPQRFAITGRKAHAVSFQPPKPPINTAANEPSRRIRASCFNFKAYTDGKAGGVRFLGKDGFHRFDKKAHAGRICHNGTLGMEINKRDFDTNVTIEIEGRAFTFASGEKEDRLQNNWYRKGVKLVVGK